MSTKAIIPHSIAPSQVVVCGLPIDHLFTKTGQTSHVRGEFLSLTAIERILASSLEYRLVEAKIGEPLVWHPLGDYRFWFDRARHQTAEPDQRISLDDFPDAKFYFVSEWSDPSSSDRVLLYEEHH